MLIDGGDTDSGEAIVGYLDAVGIRGLDVVLATHPDTKNIAGLIPIIETLPVGTVVTNGQEVPSRTYNELIRTVEDRKLPLLTGRRGDLIELDPEVTLTVLSPPEPPLSGTTSDVNSNAIVLRIEYSEASFLFTSDIPSDAEDYAMVKSGVLKVADHGSAYSTTDAFLEVVDPEIAVITVEENAALGYPSKKTLERLDRRGIGTYKTENAGTVLITTLGSGYNVSVSRDIIPPSIKINSPEEDSEAPRELIINASFDELVEEAWYAIDGEVSKGGARNTKEALFNLTLEEEGPHTLTLYARDAAGNLNSTTRRFSVDIELPSEMPRVRLAYAHPKAAGSERTNLHDEYVRIANEGTGAQEMGGWTLSNSRAEEYRFPGGFSLGGENTVTVRTGKGRDTGRDLYMNRSSPFWENTGDVAFLNDREGNLVDSLSM